METLAIRQNPDIKEIAIRNEETQLLQCADDATAKLGDTDSAKTVFELLNLFQVISDLKIDCPKAEGMWIGS